MSKKLDYIVKFDFTYISKRGAFIGKSGEVDITADATPEQLKDNRELLGLITSDMARKTKQTIFSVDITDISLKK